MTMLGPPSNQDDAECGLGAEMDTNHESLSRAKDRAQLTATGAMSIVNVALFKQVLDQGPTGNPYYIASLVLICTSLGLQVLAGLIAIMMTSLTGYYSKHQDDVCEDLCENMCCCRCVWRRPYNRNRRGYDPRHNDVGPNVTPPNNDVIDDDVNEIHEAIELRTRLEMAEDVVRSPPRRQLSTAEKIGFCPCFLTSAVLEDFEYDILERFHDWQKYMVSLEVKAAGSKIMVEYLNEQIVKAQEEIDDFKKREPVEVSHDNETPENREEIINLEKEVEEHEKKIAKHEDIIRKWNMSRAKGTYLEEKAAAIRRNRILKRATFWQHFINFLFFVVFILNAFIIGIGIVGNDDKTIPVVTPMNENGDDT